MTRDKWGQKWAPRIGDRVCDGLGHGTITSVSRGGSQVTVQWDEGLTHKRQVWDTQELGLLQIVKSKK